MTNDQMEAILTRALADDGFLTKLLANPEDAARELGVTLSAQEAETVRKLTPDEFRAFAAEYRSATDPSKRRAAC